MIRVAVSFHKDGDHLSVNEVPRWAVIWEWFANRFCPCCGISGLLSRWEPLELVFYRFWNRMLDVTWHHTKTLYEVPITSGCEAYRAIGDPHASCWRDDCEVCWEDREDAYSERT